MSNMIIETIKRLSVEVFFVVMAIAAVVIAYATLLLLVSPFCQ